MKDRMRNGAEHTKKEPENLRESSLAVNPVHRIFVFFLISSTAQDSEQHQEEIDKIEVEF